jgi:hypothetical protein
MVSVVFDHAGFWWRNELRRRNSTPLDSIPCSLPPPHRPFAVLSGLALSKGKLLGTGALAMHHYFVWPAFGLMVGLAVWRFVMREREARRVGGRYLVLATLAVVSMMAAGYWGGEMIIGQ